MDAAPLKSGMITTTEDVVIGHKAGELLPAAQTYTVLIGSLAGPKLAAGAGTVAIGQKTLVTASVGQSSVAIGGMAGASVPSTLDDVFLGYGACQFGNGTNLGRRTFIGAGAGDFDCGDYNIYVGWKAGKQSSANNAADSWGNIGIGATSLNAITGFGNVCIGHAAGTVMTSASSNLAIGYRAGATITTGGNNTFLGYEAGQGHATTARCIFLGVSAGNTVPDGAQNIFVAGAGTSNGGDRIDHVFFGKGYAHAAPTAYTVNGTGGAGANIAGADIRIAGGKGTGLASGGNVVLQVAPAGSAGSAPNSLVDALTIAPDLKADFAGPIQFAPGSSIAPTNNGDVVIEMTNSATLTFKAKGSDGIVRSATLTLS
jgi:hypothetical protein